jgi:hypothetical protein
MNRRDHVNFSSLSFYLHYDTPDARWTTHTSTSTLSLSGFQSEMMMCYVTPRDDEAAVQVDGMVKQYPRRIFDGSRVFVDMFGLPQAAGKPIDGECQEHPLRLVLVLGIRPRYVD